MSKLLYILPVFLFITIFPACADWCQTTGGGVEECGATIPSSWTECGTFGGGTVWCWPQTKASGSSNSKSTTNTLIAVGAGIAFVTIMWYIFKTPASKDNPGQVKLVAF